VQSLKSLYLKRSRKQEREHRVLLGLVDLYIQSGRPVGSSKLKEHGCQDLSSATIRNYFSKLEKEEFLLQQHSSGGRIPTSKAYQLYAKEALSDPLLFDEDKEALSVIGNKDEKELVRHLQDSVDLLSKQANVAVFLSSPRFDHDFIVQVKLVSIDVSRSLVVMMTDFGLVHTELIHLPEQLSAFALKRIENYFQWRVLGAAEPVGLSKAEEVLAQKFYNEVMIRYIVGYSHFSYDDTYSSGLSQLLNYPEFSDPELLIKALSLFENHQQLRNVMRHCQKTNKLSYWIGDELHSLLPNADYCTILSCPYEIRGSSVGTVLLLAPMRIPYARLFGMVHYYCKVLSDYLTKTLSKYQLEYRSSTHTVTQQIEGNDWVIPQHSPQLLLEEKE
jgi:heat-inducible transcriptional repressor